jgi:hypothetical protein
VWQALRDKYHNQGFELVTVGLDSLGAEGCRAFIEAASPKHPSLIDQHHVVAQLFGVINIPSAIWIDEAGMIVRPAETAPSPPKDDPFENMDLPADLPDRMVEMMGYASQIRSDSETYHAALADWVEKGAASRYAMTPEKVVERSRPRDANKSLGHAHFELASHLEAEGDHELAVKHFREAHRLVPDSWTFRRQAWSLEPVGEGPLARFWQGPNPEDPESWPYSGDWVEDIKREGPENYNEPFTE